MGSFSDWKVRGVSGSELDRSAEWGNRMKADLAEARAEIARLREALERIAAMPEGNSTDGGLEPSLEAQIAQKALDTQAREEG